MDRDDFENIVHGYFSGLLRSWQLLGDYNFAWMQGQLHAYGVLSRRDSFAERYTSAYSLQELGKIVSATGCAPVWEILDDETPEETQFPDVPGPLLLMTTALQRHSPLQSLTTRTPISIPTIPLSDTDRADIHGWDVGYKECESLWLGSGDLEIPAYEQMSTIESDLSRKGRSLCSAVERQTGRPTFYFLFKNWGRSSTSTEALEFRLCPGCGCPWHSTEVPDKSDLPHFAFKCNTCRLVSHEAIEFDNDHLASIGEWAAD